VVVSASVFGAVFFLAGFINTWVGTYILERWDPKFGRDGSFSLGLLILRYLTLGSTTAFALVQALGRQRLVQRSAGQCALVSAGAAVLALALSNVVPFLPIVAALGAPTWFTYSCVACGPGLVAGCLVVGVLVLQGRS